MEKMLSKEVKYGKAVARVTVRFYNPIVNSDWGQFESEKVEKVVKVEIIVNGQAAESGHPVLLQDNEYHHRTMVRANLNLNKEYSKVGNAITEGNEAYNNIKNAIEELEEQLNKEFNQKTEKEINIEEAQNIIEQAEKEGIENLMTDDQLKVWRENYNNLHNEGGEGYIPLKISKERYDRAVKTLGQ